MQSKKRQPWHLFLLVSLVKIPSAWQMASVLFIAPDKIAGSFECSIRGNSTKDGVSDPCRTYITKNISLLTSVNSSEDQELVLCEDFEFHDVYYSIIDQWQLVCRRKILVSVSQFFYLVGVWTGGVTCTFLMWIYPPDLIFVGGMAVQVLASTAVAVSPYFLLHCLLRFITATACTFMFTSGYTISTGLMEGKAKIVAGCCYEHFWSVGVITLPCIAYLFSDWRHLQLAISLPTIVLLFLFRFIPKCPGWEPKKKIEQNNVMAAQNVTSSEENKVTVEKTSELGSSMKGSNVLHISHKSFRQKLRSAALHAMWAFTVVTYYGGLLNVKNLGHPLFISTITAGLAEIAGTLLGLALVLWASSVWLTLGIMNVTGGIACVLSWTLPNDVEDMYYVLLMIAMFGRIAVATCLTILTAATKSLFPRGYRDAGMFTCVTLGRAVLLTAPFIGNLAVFGKPVPLTVFGALTLMGGLAALILAACEEDSNGISENNGNGCYRSKSPLDAEERKNSNVAEREEKNTTDAKCVAA